MCTTRQALRKTLADRQQQNAELEQKVRGLEARYREEVAPLEEQVLRVQRDHLRRAAQMHMRSARHRNAYHEAERAYNRFREHHASSSTSDQRHKAAYRKASKRCHPDRVSPQFRTQAEATFQALESAYDAGHGAAVDAIAQALETWGFPVRERADAVPQRPLEDLQAAVDELGDAIQHTQRGKAYQALQEAGGDDVLLESRKKTLLRHLRTLKTVRESEGSGFR